jgi:hypothetical protein
MERLRYDLLCRAWNDRGKAYSAQERIFSNMLLIRYERLSIFIRDKSIFSSERMLRKGYDCKGSAAKINSGRDLVGLGAKTN